MSLDEALAAAQAADRMSRIEWRDRIAEHGPDGIAAVMDWVGDPELTRFAVRVIEHTAKFGDLDVAIAALASAMKTAPTPEIRADIADALARLRPGGTKLAPASPKGTHIPARAGWEWPGFKASDFGRVEGTSWRRYRDPVGLIPLLLRPLLELDSAFGSYAIYMSPEVHLADRDRYLQGDEWKQGWRASKLVVYAHGPTAGRPDELPKVAAGWYIEKGTGTDEFGPVEAVHWDWPRLLDVLRDPVRRAPLDVAVARHGLRMGDYTGGRFTPAGAACGFVGALEDGELVMRDLDGLVMARGWDGLVGLMDAFPADEWQDFHIWREWPASVAIEMGQPFALRELAPVLTDLARVYLDVIGMVPYNARTAAR
jgi:hypothetical protein